MSGDSGQPQLDAARPGSVLGGKYRIERELARGGMGVVVLATHVRLDRPVAIKLLDARGKDPAYLAARFAREARAAARLGGVHVVQILDFDEAPDGTPYLVMELLVGQDLERLLGREGPLAPARAVDLGLQACVALAEAHGRGVVHRDVKPSNLFLARGADGTSRLKLLDFGISKLLDGGVSLTRTATALGSPMYMSPEQLLDPRTVDPRSDVWAVGVTLFRLLCNRPPFDAPDASSVAAQIAARPPLDLAALAPTLPAGLAAVVMRCLEKEPQRRFASVVALAEALEPFRDATSVASLSQVRALADAASRAGPFPEPPPSGVAVERAGWTLSHDLPPQPALPASPAVAGTPRPSATTEPTPSPSPRPPSTQSPRWAQVAAIVLALTALVGAVLWGAQPRPASTSAPVAGAPGPTAAQPPRAGVEAAPVSAAPNEATATPSAVPRADAGVRVRHARSEAGTTRDPADLELK
jgi:eukaryotic-like serine/threonine-protein kinase